MNLESVFGSLRRKYMNKAASQSRSARSRTRLNVQTLESREVPAVLPDPIIDATTIRNIPDNPATPNPAFPNNDTAVTVVQDPLNSSYLVAASVRRLRDNNGNLTTNTEVALTYSSNGGSSWVNGGVLPNGTDPIPTTADFSTFVTYSNVSNPSLAFDRFHNFYLTYTEHNVAGDSGRLVLRKYNFSGTPSAVQINRFGSTSDPEATVYQWAGTDPAYNPTVGVDANALIGQPGGPTASDNQVDPLAETQTDEDHVKVFVAWNSADKAPTGATANYVNSTVRMVLSSDGGVSFSPSVIVNDTGHFTGTTNTQYTAPKITFTPGRADQAGSGGQMITAFTAKSDTTAPTIVTDVASFGAANVNPALDNEPKSWEGSSSVNAILPNASTFTPPGGSAVTVPGVLDYTINVPSGSGITDLQNLSVKLALQHNDLSELKIVLIAPDQRLTDPQAPAPRQITLLRSTKQSGTGTGITGTLLGLTDNTSGNDDFAVGTTFTDDAGRSIRDATAASPFAGDFRPEGGSLDNVFGGMTAAELEGDWTLEFTDYVATDLSQTQFQDLPKILRASIQMSQNFNDDLGTDHASGIAVNGNSITGLNNPTVTPANPAGVGSGVSLAIDNTAGSFSPYQNRLYAAYVSGGNVTVNYSDDGGVRWSSKPTVMGPGFNPEIAVDNATGTVVVSYYSSAQDPSGKRSLMMMATSIDGPDLTINGGLPNQALVFSKAVAVNPTDTAYDQITSKDVTIESVPSNPANLGPEAYGNQTGLTVHGGKVTLLYTGNVDRTFTRDGTTSQIRTQNITISSGPRIIAADTGSILGGAEIEDDSSGFPSIIDYNGPAASGQAQFEKFYVEFDRVIDPSTFTKDDVKIIYRAPGADPTSNGTQIAAGNVVPLDDILDPVSGNSYGSKRFLITLATPQTAVGTYSYAIGNLGVYDGGRFGTTDINGISDRIPSASNVLSVLPADPANDVYDSSQFAAPGSLPLQISDPFGGVITTESSTMTLPATPNGEVVGKLTVTVNVTHTDVSQLRFILQSPTGQSVLLMNNGDGFGSNLTLTTFDDAATDTIASTFDIAPYTGNYKPLTSLSAFLGTRVDGDWTLFCQDSVTGDEGTLDSWSLNITKANVVSGTKSGNQMDQNGNSIQNEGATDAFSVPESQNGTPFVLPYVPVSLPVTVPGPRIVESQPIGQPNAADNVVVNATGSGLDVQFDRTMSTPTFTSADILRLIGPAGDLPLTGITVTPITALGGTVTTGNSRFYRITIPTQSLAGQYQIQLSSDIRDASGATPLTGNQMDKDSNAGVNILLGSSANAAATIPRSYGGTTSVSVPAHSSATASININGTTDGYLVQKLTAALSMTVPGGDLRNIEARLVSPDGSVSVQLFTNIIGPNTAISNVTFTDDSIITPTISAVPVQAGFRNGGFNNPISPLAQLNGMLAKGIWQLVINNKGAVAANVTQFGLTFTQPLLGTGVGDAVADQTSLNFRIFQADASTATAKANWNPVGPDGQTTGGLSTTTSGRVSSLQVDPSDPSGNTVYAAGASGGVWRTTNFLTRDPAGPSWVPLTDFGANQTTTDPATGQVRDGQSINVGSIAVFNNTSDPSKTAILVGTGSEALNMQNGGVSGNNYNGVGFLYSPDAGKTWQVLDSKTNYGVPVGSKAGTAAKFLPVTDTQRNHQFVGSVVLKVMFEKKLVNDGTAPIMYAVVGQGDTPAADKTAGVWRSLNGGQTWTQIYQGDATDFTISEGSAQPNTSNRPTNAFIGVRGTGVLFTTNLTANVPNWALTNGLSGRPDVRQLDTNGFSVAVPVQAPVDTPNGAKGRIVLVTPQFINGNPLANLYYKDWVVAAVSTTAGKLDGVYVSKDKGANWTKLNLNTTQGFNDTSPDIETLNGAPFNNFFSGSDADVTLSLAMDPQNPNILYLGSDRLIKIDMTLVNDPYKLQMYSHSDTTGTLYDQTTGSVSDTSNAGGGLISTDFTNPDAPLGLSSLTPIDNAYDLALGADPRRNWNFLNMVRDPYQPFQTDTTLSTKNLAAFQNNGTEVTWLQPAVENFTTLAGKVVGLVEPGADFDSVSSLLTIVDPLTGTTRVIWGHDQGIGTFVSNTDGSIQTVNGFNQPAAGLPNDTDLQVNGSRNGDISIARLYSGDVQPSLLAASISQSLLAAAARRTDDVFESDAGILGTGDTTFSNDGRGDIASYVATDKTGSGNVYILRDPTSISVPTDFFQIQLNGSTPISRTRGLFDAGSGGAAQWNTVVRQFAVNPIDGNAIAISSSVGRVFATTNLGLDWNVIANPSDLDGSYAPAIAYGPPQVAVAGQAAPALDDYVYVGTNNGHIYVRNGVQAQNWTNISGAAGLDGSPIVKIVPSTVRGNNSLYAVTQDGVYYMSDWTKPASTWKNVSGNLFALKQSAFSLGADYSTSVLEHITSLAVDWRPTYSSSAASPVLYVSGDSGVFRSIDGGVTWARFGTGANGGGLPLVKVSDLELALGNTIQTTGRTDPSGSPDLLLATTLGRGMWTIALGKPAGSSGPKIIPENTTPSAPITGSFSSFTVEFDSFMTPTSFTSDDVTIVGPKGNIIPSSEFTVTDVTVPSPTGSNLHNQFEIDLLNPLTDDGSYTITIGPNITDGGGTPMNQDGDAINGEAVTKTSVGDAYRFTVVLGNNDIADFINDSYQQLLGRPVTNAEYVKADPALEKARLTGLGVVVKELLSGYSPAVAATPTSPAIAASYGDETARIQEIKRLFVGAGPNEIGNFLPNLNGADIDTQVATYVTAIKNGTMSPEKVVILITSGLDYFASTQSNINNPNADEYLTKLYADLFKGVAINPLTDLTPAVRAAQEKQALTPTGRNALVTSLVNGAVVSYTHNGAKLTTNYRNNFITLAYQQVFGPGRVVTATELAAAKTAMAKALAKNTLAGSENVYALIFASKEYFDLQTQNEPASPAGDPADNGLHTDRSWVEGVIKDRYFGRTPDADGLFSTMAERDRYSQKVLDTFKTARQTFVRAITALPEYKQKQVTTYYAFVYGASRVPTATELTTGAKYATIPNLIATQLASAEFASTTPPAGPGFQTMYSITGVDPNSSILTSGTAAQIKYNLAIVWAKATYKLLFNVDLPILNDNTGTQLDYLAKYSVTYGRASAALAVLNAVDGAADTLATASKFKPTVGPGGTYREVLINQYYNATLGRNVVGLVAGHVPSPTSEAGKALTFLKTNRWEYLQADIMLSRDFFEIVG
ncbi:proprotein convertase P-domain-containing protein [Zavarzinella formosa]|uniref:proprotein convertase P-domain-containing protein n=1 Tax=Zavarzinella formosa TaxID=360055 RepID=UPI0002F17D45|nr:proprotein convertase P-domain-containing protein [Zavarzinella formosa]